MNRRRSPARRQGFSLRRDGPQDFKIAALAPLAYSTASRTPKSTMCNSTATITHLHHYTRYPSGLFTTRFSRNFSSVHACTCKYVPVDVRCYRTLTLQGKGEGYGTALQTRG